MIAQQRGFKNGWVSNKYKEKFGCWPAKLERIPLRPTKAVKEFERESYARYKEEKKQGKNTNETSTGATAQNG